ncbi:MAG TPA: hypothetical protein VIU45_05025, partial [Chitinophagaceae bacterium]
MKNTMLKLIDCSFDFLPGFDRPATVIKEHEAGFGYTEFIRERAEVIAIEHTGFEGEEMVRGIRYRFFRGGGRFTRVPLKALHYIKRQQPDIIIAQGLIFPLQVIALRLKMGSKCPIIVQHHGEKPFTGIKRR